MILYGEVLYHAGITVLGIAAGVGVLAAVIFSITGRQLKKTLDQEYGEQRHR